MGPKNSPGSARSHEEDGMVDERHRLELLSRGMKGQRLDDDGLPPPEQARRSTAKEEALRALASVKATLNRSLSDSKTTLGRSLSSSVDGLTLVQARATLEYAEEQVAAIQETKRTRRGSKLERAG